MCQMLEPKTWEDVQNIKDAQFKNKWLETANEKIKSLKQNKTWKLIKPIPGKPVVRCKWTFRAKRNANGSIETR